MAVARLIRITLIRWSPICVGGFPEDVTARFGARWLLCGPIRIRPSRRRSGRT